MYKIYITYMCVCVRVCIYICYVIALDHENYVFKPIMIIVIIFKTKQNSIR